jgi:hypothetical protein
VLFSDKKIASLLNKRFACSWESVHPVVRCEIDFGDGRKLSRTLNGNVATYLCTSEGEVFDIVSGVATREAFLARLELALRFHEKLTALAPETRRDAARRYHETMKDAEGRSPAEIARAAEAVRRAPDLSKRMVEQRIKDSMKGAADLLVARSELSKLERREDVSKRVVERPVKNTLHEDTAFNHEERAPKLHALLAKRAFETPSELTKTVYREILEVDLDDPYLGLAPYVVGGEIGRK